MNVHWLIHVDTNGGSVFQARYIKLKKSNKNNDLEVAHPQSGSSST